MRSLDTFGPAARGQDGRAGRAQDHILVVEDDEDSLYTLTMQLSLCGYDNVSVARDGEAAIAFLRRSSVDLVLLDLMMPVCDGYDVLEWIRSQGEQADMPVIVISALDTPAAIVRSVKLGAADFIPKPIASDLLRARVQASLVRAQAFEVARTPEAPALPAPADSTLLGRTLESLSVAAIIVGAQAKVLAANSRAAAVLTDGLSQDDGCLRAADADSQKTLLALIEAILDGSLASKAIALRRPSRRLPLLVRAQALGSAPPPVEAPCALLLVADPESGPTPHVTEELTLLGLTQGEGRVAALVGCGHSPREAATRLGIAEATVRTVLKRVFEKLQIRRQGELATFISQIALISNRHTETP